MDILESYVLELYISDTCIRQWYEVPCLIFFFLYTFALWPAPPVVTLSVAGDTSGHSSLLCSSQGFYPKAIEQVWLCENQPLNITLSDRKTEVNPDVSFTLHSYLPLSAEPSQPERYSCWVNHSALHQPVTVHHYVNNSSFLNGRSYGECQQFMLLKKLPECNI